jgi:hypothetical protein
LENGPDRPLAVRGAHLLPWTPTGYLAPKPRPHGVDVDVLTPPGIIGALAAGYRPHWHPSADASPPNRS